MSIFHSDLCSGDVLSAVTYPFQGQNLVPSCLTKSSVNTGGVNKEMNVSSRPRMEAVATTV